MPITATCPKCNQEYRLKDDVAGKKFRCKACQAVVTVPEPSADPGGHKDPWDDLDLDAFDDNPYAETGETLEAPRRRKKKTSKKRRRSGSMPISIMLAIGGEIALICENLLLILANLLVQDFRHVGGAVIRIVIEIAFIRGYILRQESARSGSIALCILAIIATAFFIALQFVTEEEPWVKIFNIIEFVLRIAVLIMIIIALSTQSARDWCDQ